MKITIEYAPNYRLKITADETIINHIKEEFYTFEEVTFKLKTKGNRPARLMKTTKKVIQFERIDKNSILVYRGLIDYVAILISQIFNSNTLGQLELDYRLPKFPKIGLSDKWRTIFSGHPRGYGDYQISDFNTLMLEPSGILEVFTSYGKTEMILAIADHLKDKKVLICVPDNTILNEIHIRGKRYGVDVGINDWSNNINVINVVGFMNSSKLNDESKKWLSEVDTVIVDECHHLTSNSFTNLYNLLDNVNRAYGLSASVDPYKGWLLTSGNYSLQEIGVKLAKIIGLSGSVRISRKHDIPVYINKIWYPLADKTDSRSAETWQEAFDCTVISDSLAKLIKIVLDDNPEINFYIPINKKESGKILYDNLYKEGINGVYWVSNELYVDNQLITGVDELEYIKNLMITNPRRFIISTRLEGFDVYNLKGVIPLMGTSHRLVLQPVGRAARSDKVLIILIYDSNSPISIHQSKLRYQKIIEEYNVVSDVNKKVGSLDKCHQN